MSLQLMAIWWLCSMRCTNTASCMIFLLLTEPSAVFAGECYDEMNRAVWNVALNAIMQASGNGTNFRLPTGAFDKLTPPIYERDVRHLTLARVQLLPGSPTPLFCSPCTSTSSTSVLHTACW